ncbi:hypothetical protein PFLUV_G00009710 [Perca fluviatilis]|uniref:Uncharacterized protein n=1 Tax=Perca fluviatilis TaxID=8168 RepID=A0A6A5FRL5_PERFL|nr:hypothetical protein PFLUV_G00009710 [Perca fluviatilis]
MRCSQNICDWLKETVYANTEDWFCTYVNESKSETFRKMKAFGIKAVALVMVIALVSSSLAKPTHVIEKRSDKETNNNSNSNAPSLARVTEVLMILKYLKDLTHQNTATAKP